MSTAPIRVLVVEDSITVRKHIIEVLSADPALEVVGEAPDGKTAIELCERLRPNVVTMDMMLPIMTGVAATEYIMAFCPTPILIVSASTNRGELFRTYDALAAGAVDVLEKSLGSEPDQDWERRLIAAVRMVARIRVITHPRARLGRMGAGAATTSASTVPISISNEPRVVAIGASTGGPGALLTILSSLPRDFPLPLLLVLHISESFASAMAEWLDAQIAIDVRYAKDGERLPPVGRGCVVMAPPDRHLEVAGGRLRVVDAPQRHSCRPSVDILFESLAREMGPQTIGCLLTGMGKDGALGLLALKTSGGLTLAQDEETCVVFGMSAEAIKLGGATHVLPLSEFGPVLTRAAAPVHSKESTR
jgi:two-component system chemotaxis response regulator CheB